MQSPILRFHKTRIAPTPSGYLHIGNALSFALTAALAKQTGAKILLRIDDLDRQRANKLYVQDIFDTLNFLEIPWDEGPRDMREYETMYSQAHRMELYEEFLKQLQENNKVFACQCSRAQIHALSDDDIYPGTCRRTAISLDSLNTSWRLRTDKNQILTINTLTNGLAATVLPAIMHDFVVRKKDGYPAYQLASLADDLHFGVDLVVRGEDLWPSTIAQHYLATALNQPAFKKITFHHHPLLMESADKKLSKSAGSTSIKYLREQGKKPADVYGKMGRLAGIEERVRSWMDLLSF